MQTISPLASGAPRPGSRTRWTSLHGSARGLAVATLAQQSDAPVLVIAADSRTAHRLETELDFYLDGETSRLRFPDWETLPYDLFSPHQDIVSERLETLAKTPSLAPGVLITTVTTGDGDESRHAASSTVTGCGSNPATASTSNAFRMRLDRAGYACVSQVMEHGEYVVRGSLFDLFSDGVPTSRCASTLLDDEVETLRLFDPDSQRTRNQVDRIDLLPAREFPTTPESVSTFRRAWAAALRRRSVAVPDLSGGQSGRLAGGHRVLPCPCSSNQTATVIDFLPRGTVIVLAEDVYDAARAFWADTRDRYDNRRHDKERPVLSPDEIFTPVEDLFSRLTEFPGVRLHRGGDNERGATVRFATQTPTGTADRRAGGPADRLPAGLPRCPCRSMPHRGGDAGTTRDPAGDPRRLMVSRRHSSSRGTSSSRAASSSP